jgi:hypothetical protein
MTLKSSIEAENANTTAETPLKEQGIKGFTFCKGETFLNPKCIFQIMN